MVVALLCSGCNPTGARRAVVPAKPATPVVSPSATPAASPTATVTQATSATVIPAPTVGTPIAAANGPSATGRTQGVVAGHTLTCVAAIPGGNDPAA